MITGVVIFVVGYSLGWHYGAKRLIFYVGSDVDKYNKATTGILLSPK